MPHELDDKLKKLAASANYSPAGLKDLFEGWDIVDFMMVEAAKLRREAHRALASNMPVARKEMRLKDVERKHKEIIGAFSEWPGGADFHHKKMEAMRRHLAE
ncbi:hypothetical protein [Tropicibacter sp. Alg240-R139]|uniref:hypothetical protein n=1 Tax=Tropicibacter sp. Alg240-R139 TaxID=2305991 RepID=UPI0013DF0045|nr:hypothetical protein [Tropicibacter sp. Alg240-R139]